MKPEKPWRAFVPGERKLFPLLAHTKSEARARLKTLLGLRGRLPVGTLFIEPGPSKS